MELMRILSIILLTCVLSVPNAAGSPESALRRTLLALYDGQEEGSASETRIHRWAESPLNHLGLVIRYHDVRLGLPDPEDLTDIRGVLTWFQSAAIEESSRYVTWAATLMDSGTRFVVLGHPGLDTHLPSGETDLRQTNRFLSLLGIRIAGQWSPVTYNIEFERKVSPMVEFERPLTGPLTPFDRITPLEANATSYLVVRQNKQAETASHLVVTTGHGGFVADGYTHFADPGQNHFQWRINPFEFFREALATDELPKPDVTTLFGRRLFYAQVDGDGWGHVSQVGRSSTSKTLSSQVVLKEILRPFSSVSFTVAPIAGDFDPSHRQNRTHIETAKAMFELTHVEAGSHSYSHPQQWGGGIHSTDGGSPNPTARSWWQRLLRYLRPGPITEADDNRPDDGGGPAVDPAPLSPDLQREIGQSVETINRLLPQSKTVQLFHWSGNTLPGEEAVARATQLGLVTINGGVNPFGKAYPSIGWVPPLGVRSGSGLQVYGANANEASYPEGGANTYFSFRHWLQMVHFTEYPRRLTPLRLYFHMTAGEKLATLNPILTILRHVQEQEIIPVSVDTYARCVQGFFEAQFVPLGRQTWRIEKRAGLDTIRFDDAAPYEVDFARSRGIVGQRHIQNSLYIALDRTDPNPILALKRSTGDVGVKNTTSAYLIQSRWHVWSVKRNGASVTFAARGFGPGQMTWMLPGRGRFLVRVEGSGGSTKELEYETNAKGVLDMTVGDGNADTVQVTVTPAAHSK